MRNVAQCGQKEAFDNYTINTSQPTLTDWSPSKPCPNQKGVFNKYWLFLHNPGWTKNTNWLSENMHERTGWCCWMKEWTRIENRATPSPLRPIEKGRLWNRWCLCCGCIYLTDWPRAPNPPHHKERVIPRNASLIAFCWFRLHNSNSRQCHHQITRIVTDYRQSVMTELQYLALGGGGSCLHRKHTLILLHLVTHITAGPLCCCTGPQVHSFMDLYLFTYRGADVCFAFN